MLEDATEEHEGWKRSKRLLAIAVGGTIAGLGVAGTLDRSTGGVVLLASWLLGIWALHSLGRAGSDRSALVPQPKPNPAEEPAPKRKKKRKAKDQAGAEKTEAEKTEAEAAKDDASEA
jgi:hypothetical protein